MDFMSLPSGHFLAQPRPDPLLPQLEGLVDTTTLAAHDFDVDTRTGFMPPQPPLDRLPALWESWESTLDLAVSQKLQLAGWVEKMEPERGTQEALKSRRWRELVKQMPLLPTENLKASERALRRAHHVLCWILHFYIQTLPSTEQILIPRLLSIPLLKVSSQLQLPPVITYSDDVLYNWTHRTPPTSDSEHDNIPTIDNLRCQTTFTSTRDEEEFYLISARIELRGTEALELMRLSMDEAFVGDDIAIHRITAYLERMAVVINELRDLLLEVKAGVDPQIFYDYIRPWFRGADSDPWQRPWIFEGKEEIDELGDWMNEMSGASAGQSSLIQALDIFLGVTPERSSPDSQLPEKSFQERMRVYMPRHHRAFLRHLQVNPRPLRALVEHASAESTADSPILSAYNAAVKALKEFRDGHMIIVALYIIGPARRAQKMAMATNTHEPVVTVQQADVKDTRNAKMDGDTLLMEKAFSVEATEKQEIKGTGGTNLVKFLKAVRDRTAGAYLEK